MAAVNAEMAVCSPDQAITMQFAHTHEARVGQIHAQIAILLYHAPYCWTLGLEVEIDSENSFSVQPTKCESRRSQIGQKMQSFGQNRFTSNERGTKPFETLQ